MATTNNHTTPKTRVILPRDLQPGMRVEFRVANVGYTDTFMQFCEILSVSKDRRGGATKYKVRIAEAVNGKLTGKESDRYLSPRDHQTVIAGDYEPVTAKRTDALMVGDIVRVDGKHLKVQEVRSLSTGWMGVRASDELFHASPARFWIVML